MAPPKLRAEWFWTDRWFSSSASFLPLEARGLYRELLTRAWSLDGKLPSDPKLLQRMVAASDEEWRRSWPLVEPYWKPEDGHLVNETQLEVMEDCRERQRVRSEKARKAARARWGQCSSNAQASAQAMPEECPPSQSLSKKKEQSPDREEKDVSEASPPHSPSPNGVDEVVAHYRSYHSRARPGKKERKKIRDRLKEGYTVENLKAAIDGCHRSPHHCGANDRGRKYQRLELIMRDSDHVADFMGIADGPQTPALPDRTQRSLGSGASWLDWKERHDGTG